MKLHKYNLAFGILSMIVVHFIRMSDAGKVCSGDYLNLADKSKSLNGYLLLRGEYLDWYMNTFWKVMGYLIAVIVITVFIVLRNLH